MTAPQRDPAGGKRPDPSSIDTRHVSAQTIEIIKETEKQNDTDFPCLRQLNKSINNNPNMIEFIQIRLCFASGKKKILERENLFKPRIASRETGKLPLHRKSNSYTGSRIISKKETHT